MHTSYAYARLHAFPNTPPSETTILTLLPPNPQGGEKYQQAFYVFEELAQAPSTSSAASLVSQAVCEIHLGRVEEAQTALDQAVAQAPQFAEAVANLLVLAVVTGKDAAELTQ